jgi:hypothetical protein
MLTEQELKGLLDFGKEEDGDYCDRWQFTIRRNPNSSVWSFYFFNEVDGELFFIKKLKDLEDLKNVYHAITNKVLAYSEEHSKKEVRGWGS